MQALLSSVSLKVTPVTIIRALPTLAKYILYLLVLLNVRSFPLAWHGTFLMHALPYNRATNFYQSGYFSQSPIYV